MIGGGASAMNSLEMIRISSWYMTFCDFEKAVVTFLKNVQMYAVTKKYKMKIREACHY